MADLVGKVLVGRYQVLEFIGRGGMSDVYKVWDRQRSVPLAAKVLREDLAEDTVFLRRFQREADHLAQLQHPNIVRFYGLERDGALAFILMDLIEGITLRRRIIENKGPLAAEEILSVLRSVCAALYYAHQNDLVHCDVKPANIMIQKNGNVLVTDFGIARMAEGVTTSTMVGAGTPAYMAPEQVRGEDPIPQTDVYALGVVLYEMLTGGERPFTGEQATITGTTGEKVRWEQVHAKPIPLKSLNPNVPCDLEAVVLKCLDKDPHKRFPNVLDLLSAVEKALSPASSHHSVSRAASTRLEEARLPQAKGTGPRMPASAPAGLGDLPPTGSAILSVSLPLIPIPERISTSGWVWAAFAAIVLVGLVTLLGWRIGKYSFSLAVTQTVQALAALLPTDTPVPPTQSIPPTSTMLPLPTRTETPAATITPLPTLTSTNITLTPFVYMDTYTVNINSDIFFNVCNWPKEDKQARITLERPDGVQSDIIDVNNVAFWYCGDIGYLYGWRISMKPDPAAGELPGLWKITIDGITSGVKVKFEVNVTE